MFNVCTCSLLVGIVVYFIMGGVVMKVKYNAAGIDLIPNRVFWKSIPGLIKVYMHL